MEALSRKDLHSGTLYEDRTDSMKLSLPNPFRVTIHFQSRLKNQMATLEVSR
jgi:hypothetical protein